MKAIPLSGLGLATLFRLGLPGIILAYALTPAIVSNLEGFREPTDHWTVLLLGTVFFGWLISTLDMHLYMIFEGRRYWPKRLLDLGVKREQRRLDRLQKRAVEQRGKEECRRSYLETCIDIALFPLNARGEPVASMPTRLGNIIAEYEDYPQRKYSLDAIFFFDRIWLKVDDDVRKELDERQARVDSTVYVSFSLILVGALFIIYSALGVSSDSGQSADGRLHWLGKSAFCFLMAYFIYRVSLRAHVRFGDAFNAFFDQHRHLVDCADLMKQLDGELGHPGLAAEGWRSLNMNAWRYLRWHRIRLPGTEVNRNYEEVRSERREYVEDAGDSTGTEHHAERTLSRRGGAG